MIELKPTRAIGTTGGGIDRNDFEIYGLAEPQQTIVGPHARMLPAGLRHHAENIANILCADFQ